MAGTTTPTNSGRSLSAGDRAVAIKTLASDRLKRAGITELQQLIARQDEKKNKKKQRSEQNASTETDPTTTKAPLPITEIHDDPFSALEIGSTLGHGQFHAVYEIKSMNQSSGFPFKIRKNPIDRVVLKTLRVQMSSPSASVEKIATGCADLVKEGMILAALSGDSDGGHPNIIQLRGWTSSGLDAFFASKSPTSGEAEFKFDRFCLVIDRLDKTLKDVVGHEWKDELEWFHERLGDEASEEDDSEDDHDDDGDSEDGDDGDDGDQKSNTKKTTTSDDHHKHQTTTPSKRQNHHHNDNHHHHHSTLSCMLSPFSFWKTLSRRSPEATKALLERKHAFFLRRLYACLELADALQYLHAHRIMHRDLKPANVGIQCRGNTNRLVVFDMDLSRVIPSSSSKNKIDDDPNRSTYNMTSMVGSRQYMAPEIAVPNTPYNLKADVYTFGLLAWEMLNVRLNPFGEYLMNDDEEIHDTTVPKMTEAQVDRAVIKDGLRPTIPRHVWCQSLVNLVSSSWAPNMEDRPTMAENQLSLQIIYSKLKSQGEMISATKEEKAVRRQRREQQRKERRLRKAAATAKSDGGPASKQPTQSTACDDEDMPSSLATDKTDEVSSTSILSNSSERDGHNDTRNKRTPPSKVGRTTEVVVV